LFSCFTKNTNIVKYINIKFLKNCFFYPEIRNKFQLFFYLFIPSNTLALRFLGNDKNDIYGLDIFFLYSSLNYFFLI
jgi:hypothetical protein